MSDTDSNEREIKRHWLDQQPFTDQERIIDGAIDREFEKMTGDERLKAGRDWRSVNEQVMFSSLANVFLFGIST